MKKSQKDASIFIVWGGLTSSPLLYLMVLFVLKKIQIVSFDLEQITLIEKIAVFAPSLLLLTLGMHKKFYANAKSATEWKNKQIICWAFNEYIALIGFIATFLSLNGNGYFAIVNIAVTTIGNLLMFPRELETRR